MQRSLFDAHPENEPDPPRFGIVDEAMDEADCAERLKNPLAALMQELHVRVLINGEGERVRERALHLLFQERMTNEVIETRLRRLAEYDPRTFDPAIVESTIVWVNTMWQQRISGDRGPRKKPR